MTLTLLVLCLVQTAQAASLGDTLLKIGSTGADVVQLQTELNYLGYNVGTTDGVFGVKTQSEVVAFQTANSLSVDGIVGSITATALNSAYAHTVKANAIIATAKTYIGVPYLWGGESPTTGFDCSGFVQYVFAQNGITLPRVSYDQATVGTPINFADLQPGDLIFFSIENNGTVDHVGIYIGNDQFINASSSLGVTIYPIGPYWESVEFSARRVF
jgi:cell wall-associated NlpC family hydrolase